MQNHLARNSVQVNARYNVSAVHAAACDINAMDSEWFSRLLKAIEDDGRSYKQISEAAGLGRNYVQQLVTNGKKPTGDKLEAILSVLGKDKSLFILTGLAISEADLDFLRLLNAVPPDRKSDMIGLLRGLSESQST